MLRPINALRVRILGSELDERGLGMITVIGAASVMVIVTTLLTVQSLNNLGQASSERQWEMALHVADSGVDHGLYKLRTSNPRGSWNTGEVLPDGLSQDAESDWVIDAANSAPADRVVATPEGEWVVIRPSNVELTYAVGYVPTRAAATKTRVIRAAYDFAPFIPTTAVLTNGDLVFNGNPDVLGISGNVHSNEDITVSGNPTVSGYVSATGTLSGDPDVGDPANSGGGKPPVEVPSIDPRANYYMSEYDLCPDGRVRTGPAYTAGAQAPNTTGIPCQGTQLAIATSTEFRGWKLTGTDSSQGAKWDYSGNTANDGVYYLYQGSAKISGNPGDAGAPWRLTLMAEATLGSGCSRIGGDIEVSGNPYFLYHDKAQPIVFLAGRDLKVSGNPDAGALNYEGFLGAAEQFFISGNPSIGGSIVSENVCQTSGSLLPSASSISGNPTITYSGMEAPLGNNIRTTLWLEI